MTRLFAGTPFDIPPSCDDCGKVESECICDPVEKAKAEEHRLRESYLIPPAQQTAFVKLEKRKGNRRATVVSGLSTRANDLPGLLSRLQEACGTGGTVKAKDEQIELQGDNVDPIRRKLADLGYRVK